MPSAKSPLKIITDMPCLFERKCFSGGISVMRYKLCRTEFDFQHMLSGGVVWIIPSYARHMYARPYSKLIVKSVLNRLWNLIGRITYFLKFKSQKAKMTENFSAKIWYLESIFKLIYVLWCSNIGYHICYMIYYMRHKLCHFIHQ